MKPRLQKFLLVCCALMFSIGAIAQPVISTDIVPVDGDSVIIGICNNAINPGPDGANQNWNFTGLNEVQQAYFNFVDPSQTPFPNQFPAATICGVSWFESYSYYGSSCDFLALVGVGTLLDSIVNPVDTALATYSDPEEILNLPANFMDLFTDSFAGTNEALGFSTPFSGNISVEIDAYGTLMLPNGTYTNVARYHFTRTENVLGMPPRVKEQWGWMSPDYRFWLMLMETIDDGTTVDSLVWYNKQPIPVSPSCQTFTQDPICAGGSNGWATVVLNGCPVAASYLWSNGATTDSIIGIPAGIYTVTVTDTNGVQSTCQAFLGNPDSLKCDIFPVDPTCSGSDGEATANGFYGDPIKDKRSGGGQGGYNFTYLWSNGQTTQTATGLSAGTYTVTITDSLGCTTSCETTLISGASFDCSVLGNDPTCSGAIDGSATVNVIVIRNGLLHADQVYPDRAGSLAGGGGGSPYTYLWSNGQTTQTATGLGSGTYTVTVSDTLGCSTTCTVTLTAPSALVLTCSGTNANCGTNDGSATVSVTGGTPPYSYAWNSGQSTASISNLSSGTYRVLVVDSAGCADSCSVTVSGTSGTQITCMATDETCAGAEDGSMTVSALTGASQLTYLWSNGETTQSISNLVPGIYTVTVTDTSGCVSTCMDTVAAGAAILVGCSSTNTSTAGGSDGTASSNAVGGASPYSFMWSNGQNTANIANLTAGTYTVTVTDNNGCSSTCSTTITDPVSGSLTVVCSGTDVSCNGGNDGTASVSASGGQAPYTYSWSNGQTGMTATGLSSGSLSVIVSDSLGLTGSCTVFISEPTALTCGIVDSTCVIFMDLGNYAHGTVMNTQFISDGITISADNNGGKPDVAIIFNSSVTGSADPDLEVNMGHLLILPNDTADSNNDGLVDAPNDNADGGTITITFNSPTNVNSFDFIDQDDNMSSMAVAYDASNNIITSVTISNMGNASVQNVSMNAVEVSKLEITLASSGAVGNFDLDCPVSAGGSGNGFLDLTASGGTPPYTYLWSNGATTEDLMGIPSGMYTVTITDDNGCSTTCSGAAARPASKLSNTSDNAANAALQASIFPNPSNGTELYLNIKNAEDPLTVRILSMLGSNIYTTRIADYRSNDPVMFETPDLPPGLYFVNIDDGMRSKTLRLIIQ